MLTQAVQSVVLAGYIANVVYSLYWLYQRRRDSFWWYGLIPLFWGMAGVGFYGLLLFADMTTAHVMRDWSPYLRALDVAAVSASWLLTCRAMRAMERRTETLAAFFEQSVVGFAITSTDGRWLRVNRTMCQMLGYDEAELRRTTWQQITYPGDLRKDEALFERVLAGELDGYTIEKRYVCKDGRVLDTLMSTKGVHRVNGVEFFATVVCDITRQKRVEQELREAKEALVEAIHISTG